MAGERFANFRIPSGLIGHHRRLAGDIGMNDRLQCADGGPVHVEAAGGASAFDKGKNNVAEGAAATRGILGRALDLADESFVYFYSPTTAAHERERAIAHGLADAMREEPRTLEGYPKGAVKLIARNSFFRRAKQVDRLQPQMQRNVRGLEDGFHAHGEGLPALVALVEANASALSLHLGDALNPAAMRTNRPFRPKSGLDIRESSLFVLELSGGEDRGSHGGISYGQNPTGWGWVCQV